MSEAGGYILRDEPISINAGRQTVRITVTNTGDRAIQVGSHFHFFEVNRALRFPREAAYGMRADIPAGTALRFEPGDTREITLVAIGGSREVTGLNALAPAPLDAPGARAAALDELELRGFSRGQGGENGRA